MSEHLAHVRSALVEAVAAQKLIEEKLRKARTELDTWRKRGQMPEIETAVQKEVGERVKQLESTIAELEVELMAQNDLEKQLKSTIFKLEHSVSVPRPPQMPDFETGDEAMERLENKILEAEVLADLTSHAEERKLEDEAKSLSLDQELEALKRAVKKKDD